MKSLLFTVDLEEFVAQEFDVDVPREMCFELAKKGFSVLLGLMKRNGIKATLFTTLEFAEFCPSLIEEALKDGHELGLHALKHKHRYGKMAEEDALRFLTEAKKKLEERFNVTIVSFRGPQMSRPSYAVLEDLGIRYDSSYHPTYVPGKYNLFFKTRAIHSHGKVTVVPVSVTPLLRLPFSWIWFRNMGFWYTQFCSSWVLRKSNYINVYFHPWEFVDVSGFKGKISTLIVGKTGNSLIHKVEDYFHWLKSKGVESKTFKEFMHGR